MSLVRSKAKERSKKQRFSEEQIAQILREGEAATAKAELWRTYGISEWTYYRWRKKYLREDRGVLPYVILAF